jgi:hypothetical protein
VHAYIKIPSVSMYAPDPQTRLCSKPTVHVFSSQHRLQARAHVRPQVSEASPPTSPSRRQAELHRPPAPMCIYIDPTASQATSPITRSTLHQVGLHRPEHTISNCTNTSSYEQVLRRVLNRQQNSSPRSTSTWSFAADAVIFDRCRRLRQDPLPP